ncbi:hypothetical protein ACNQGB_05405 [Flavobacterium sp. XS1P32]|uniref:hypothetical protein n=1 Tax=Flavobacterium sp. XS1P32 TaxID=3401726 RepID=UPI003AAEBBB4
MLKKSIFIYTIISTCIIVLNEITKWLLNFDNLVYNSLSDQLTSAQINKYLEFQNKWQWLGNILIPFLLFIKTSLIASILYMGTFFFSKKEVSYKTLWDIAIKAEFIFLLVAVCKIIWFYFFQTNYSLEDIQYFYPLSAINITGYDGLEYWYIYPFQTLNLFELAYWLVLAYFIGKATETNMDKGLKIVAYSYGPVLLLWMVVIMFVTLNYS